MNKQTKKPKKSDSIVAPNTTLELNIPWKEASKAYQASLKKLAKTVKSDGFRKGKVPLNIAEKIIGQAKLIEHALDKALPEIYQKAVKKAERKKAERRFSLIQM